MAKTTGHIIKASDVTLQGQFHLDVVRTRPDTRIAAQAKSQVCLVENQPEFAIVEVSCCCGEKLYLRCEYANNQALESSQMQNGGLQAHDQQSNERR